MLALDGNSLYHRAHHAYERSGLTGADGRPTFATYGFFVLLAGICTKVRPDALVVGFDSPRNERKARWPQYKATRAKKDDAFYTQMDATIALLHDIGVYVVQPDGWEADDVCASTARAAADAGWRCVIATSDRDAFALIDDTTAVLRLVSGLDNAELLDRDGFRSMMAANTGFAFDASSYRSYAALRGDTSDNLPGVRGVGEKTAAKLLAHSTVEDVLADPDRHVELLGRGNVAKLTAGAGNYQVNLAVMAMRRDLAVDLDSAVLPVDAAVARDRLAPILPTIANRVADALAGPTAATAAVRPSAPHGADDAAAAARGAQPSLFD